MKFAYFTFTKRSVHDISSALVVSTTSGYIDFLYNDGGDGGGWGNVLATSDRGSSNISPLCTIPLTYNSP